MWAAAEPADPAQRPVPAPLPAAPVLRAAALLQRARETFRRLRPHRPTRTDALPAAEQALDRR